MVGTLPHTMLLLTCNEMVVGHFPSYVSVALFLDVTVDMETGIVSLGGVPQTPHYIVKEGGSTLYNDHWKSSGDIIKDWSRKHLKLPQGYRIYRYLT